MEERKRLRPREGAARPSATRSRRVSARPKATLAVGSVLARSLSAWGRNAVAFTLVSVVVHVPLFLYHGYVPFVDEFGQPRTMALLGELLVSAVLGLLATGPMTYGVVQQLRGVPASVGECLSMGFRRFLPAVLTSLLLLVYLAVMLWVCQFLAGGFVFAIAGASESRTVAILLFAFLLWAPMFFAYGVFWLAVPVTIIENPGPQKSLGRSSRLTSNNVLRIICVLVLLFLAQWGLGLLAATVLGHPAAEWIGVAATAALFAPLRAVACAVCYHDLRLAKEGVGVADLARVFE